MKLSHYSSLLCLLSAILLCGAHSASVKDKQAETDLVLVETEQEERPEVYERVGAFSKDDYDPYAPRFIPSREWQAIKKGQAIPPGLHVRMNLETGEREAKLLDGDDGSRFEIAAPDELDETIEGRTVEYLSVEKLYTRKELKEALKKLKASKDDVTSRAVPDQKYRSAEELKDAFKEMNLKVKTDNEILRELLAEYSIPDISTQYRVNILTDLEFYVHQIDNAKDLVDLGGLEHLVRDLNHTAEEVRSEAAVVIGSAVQS